MEINWLQIVAIILGSGVISALLSGLWLNVRTEKIKTDFQRNLYEFQTRYSVLHKERAEVIQTLFALLTKLNRNAQHLESIKKLSSYEQSESLFNSLGIKLKDLELASITRFLNDYQTLDNFYVGKSIYLSQEICQQVDKLLNEGADLLIIHSFQSNFKEKLKESLTEKDFNQFLLKFNETNADKLSYTIKLLEKEFQQLLSAENPNHQLEKK